MANDTTNGTLEVQGFTPYAQVPRWILRSGDRLSHGAVRLYGVLMTYASNDKRAAFPSRETLGKDLGASIRSISTYVKDLEDFGALLVTRRRNKRTGNFYANHYILLFEEPSATDCTRRDATGFPITTPTKDKLDSPSVTSNVPSDEQETFTTEHSSSAITRPFGIDEPTWTRLRNALRAAAATQEHDDWYTVIDMLHERLDGIVDLDLIDSWAEKWTLSTSDAQPYAAGEQLTMFLNSVGTGW